MTLNNLALTLLSLSRGIKRFLVLSMDASACILTVWLAFCLRMGEFVAFSQPVQWTALVSLIVALPIFIWSGLYMAIFRHAGWPAIMAVTKATAGYAFIFLCLYSIIGISGVPREVGLIQPILLLLVLVYSRALAHFWLGSLYQDDVERASRTRALIYGAGEAGRQLAAALSTSTSLQIVGFMDDDERLHRNVLNGLPIYSPEDLPSLVGSLNISDVLLALPSVSRKRRNEILQSVLQTRVSVRTLPSIIELAEGKVAMSDLRELNINDLLGRDPVAPDLVLLGQNNTYKTVLVTGAGGSIGSELCRQLLKVEPACLLLVEQSEFALYEIHQELQTSLELQENTAIKLVPLLASIRDERRIGEIIATWRPQTVYHAAAYKHVPLVEHNPAEGVWNNSFGTLTVAESAARHGVADFVLISTDKAVRPTNIMGASKRLAEMCLQALAATMPETKFSMVRFGNVLGSSGSVVPKFLQQIRDGGPITLTHADITRYFMTIPEAAQLVIQAGAMARGGDVFVLDMGQPVRIIDMATRMIELLGLTVRSADHPDGDIEIRVTGLRPGEKLYEELLIGDNPEQTSHPRIMMAHESFLPWPVLQEKLAELQDALHRHEMAKLRQLLSQLVSGYEPTGEIVDWVHLRQEAESGAHTHSA